MFSSVLSRLRRLTRRLPLPRFGGSAVAGVPHGALGTPRPVLAAGAVLALAACDPGALQLTGPSTRVDTDRPVQVALLVPGGSSDSGRNTIARDLEAAARMAVADLQGVQVDLRVYQTAGDAARAASEASRAVDDGARIILGPVFSQSATAVGQAVAPRNVNVLSFSNNTDVAGGNVFVLGHTFENTAQRLLAHAAQEGKGRVAVVSERTSEGEVAKRAIQRAAARTNASIVGTQDYSFSQQGVVDALPSIGSMVRSSGAQSLFFTANSAGALPLLAQLLPENRVGPSDYQFMGLARWDIPPETLQLDGLQGGWFALPDPALMRQFEARFTAANGNAPHPIAALGYDGVAAIGALLGSGRSDAFSREALTQASGFAGVNGVFRLRADGTNERGLAVARIEDQEVVVIAPAPRSFAGTGF